MNSLTDELEDLLVKYASGEVQWSAVEELIEEIKTLSEDALVASTILGYMSPWDAEPGVELAASLVVHHGRPSKKWRWPQLQKAVDWLRQTLTVPYSELADMVASARANVFVSGTLTDPTEIDLLKSGVEQSIKAGDSLSDFRARVQDISALTRAETETVFRTNTKRAYLGGQQDILRKPAVKRLFPYVLFNSTQDGRTRPWHKALDGWIAEVDSPLHHVFMRVQTEYNCRCALVPVSERRLNGRRVRAVDDLPSQLWSHYF